MAGNDGKHHLLTFLANGGRFSLDFDFLQFSSCRKGKGMLASLTALDGQGQGCQLGYQRVPVFMEDDRNSLICQMEDGNYIHLPNFSPVIVLFMDKPDLARGFQKKFPAKICLIGTQGDLANPLGDPNPLGCYRLSRDKGNAQNNA